MKKVYEPRKLWSTYTLKPECVNFVAPTLAGTRCMCGLRLAAVSGRPLIEPVQAHRFLDLLEKGAHRLGIWVRA